MITRVVGVGSSTFSELLMRTCQGGVLRAAVGCVVHAPTPVWTWDLVLVCVRAYPSLSTGSGKRYRPTPAPPHRQCGDGPLHIALNACLGVVVLSCRNPGGFIVINFGVSIGMVSMFASNGKEWGRAQVVTVATLFAHDHDGPLFIRRE